MREVFQQELQEVQERLVEISTLVATSISNATEAFGDRGPHHPTRRAVGRRNGDDVHGVAPVTTRLWAEG